jgi:prevent-host-death family protein
MRLSCATRFRSRDKPGLPENPGLRYNMTMVCDHGSFDMKSATIPAGEFKAKCLKLIDNVAETGKTLVITKRGKPVAEVKPIPARKGSLFGSMRGSGEITGDIISPIKVEWEAMK